MCLGRGLVQAANGVSSFNNIWCQQAQLAEWVAGSAGGARGARGQGEGGTVGRA